MEYSMGPHNRNSITQNNPKSWSFFFAGFSVEASLSNVAVSMLAQVTNYSVICGAYGLGRQISIHYMYNHLFWFMLLSVLVFKMSKGLRIASQVSRTKKMKILTLNIKEKWT
jgi:fumarate reductase subunit D